MRLLIFVFFTLATLLDCARFRVQELKPERIFTVPLVVAFPHLAKGADDTTRPIVLSGIPNSTGFLGSRLLLPDATAGVVRSFKNGSDKPETVFSDHQEKGDDIDWVKIKGGIPGMIATDGDESAYIEMHDALTEDKPEPTVPPEKRTTDKWNPNVFNSSPSRIIYVKDNAPQGSFGREGKEGPAFERILRMQPGEGGLYVLHTIAGVKALSVFQGLKRIRTYENFTIPDADAIKYQVEIEDIVPVTGAGVMVSAVLRNKNTFAPESRRIYGWDGESSRMIYQSDDEGDQFVGGTPEGGFMLAESEDGARMLIKFYSASGEYLNNKLIVFPDFRNSWREVSIDLGGHIYSNRIFKGNFEVYEWK